MYNQRNRKNQTWKTASKAWKISATAFFVLYIGFALLNRFVIPQNVVALETVATTQGFSNSELNLGLSQKQDTDDSETTNFEPIVTQNSYKSENIDVVISTERLYDTDIYIAEIKISDSSLLKTGLAYGSFGNNLKQTTSEILQDNSGIIGINGDFYGFRDTGYVMRNGHLYRDVGMEGGNSDLVIFEDGTFDVVEETEISAAELQDMGARQIFSFGPGLISDGEIIVDENSKVDREDESNPRTAIGMIEPNHYIMLVADGRTEQSDGLSIVEIANVLKSYGCAEAYNLDGGGSATMVFMGEVVNNPTTNGKTFKERSVSDIVYIGE